MFTNNKIYLFNVQINTHTCKKMSHEKTNFPLPGLPAEEILGFTEIDENLKSVINKLAKFQKVFVKFKLASYNKVLIDKTKLAYLQGLEQDKVHNKMLKEECRRKDKIIEKLICENRELRESKENHYRQVHSFQRKLEDLDREREDFDKKIRTVKEMFVGPSSSRSKCRSRSSSRSRSRSLERPRSKSKRSSSKSIYKPEEYGYYEKDKDKETDKKADDKISQLVYEDIQKLKNNEEQCSEHSCKKAKFELKNEFLEGDSESSNFGQNNDFSSSSCSSLQNVIKKDTFACVSSSSSRSETTPLYPKNWTNYNESKYILQVNKDILDQFNHYNQHTITCPNGLSGAENISRLGDNLKIKPSDSPLVKIGKMLFHDYLEVPVEWTKNKSSKSERDGLGQFIEYDICKMSEKKIDLRPSGVIILDDDLFDKTKTFKPSSSNNQYLTTRIVYISNPKTDFEFKGEIVLKSIPFRFHIGEILNVDKEVLGYEKIIFPVRFTKMKLKNGEMIASFVEPIFEGRKAFCNTFKYRIVQGCWNY